MKCGIATLNDAYDTNDPTKMRREGIEPVLWVKTKLHFSASFDECGLDSATTGGGNNSRKARGERIVLAGDGDDGETVSSRGGTKVTLVGGSYLDNEPTIPGIIMPTQSLSEEAYDRHIPSLAIDGEMKRAHLMSRESGGMTSDLIIEYVQQCIAWRWAGRDADQWCVLTTDGVGTHISMEFLEWCQSNRIYLCLRCPYASSIQQPEDVILFLRLKNMKDKGFYKAKQHLVARLFVHNLSTSLTVAQILECAKPAIEATFTSDNISLAWRLAGYMPFLVGQYWDLQDKEEALEASSSSSSSSSTSSSSLSSSPSTRLGFNINIENGEAYEAFAYVDRDQSTSHHASSYAFIRGSASGTAAIEMGKWHAEIRAILSMKLKDAVTVLTAAAVKAAEDHPRATTLKATIHSNSHTRMKNDKTTPHAVNAAEARARLLAFAMIKTNQNHFPHAMLSKAETYHPVMYALPLECEKLLAVLDHRFFSEKRGVSARMLLDEQSKRPREPEDQEAAAAADATAVAAAAAAAEEQLAAKFGF